MSDFKMPLPHLGQVVNWYPGGVRTAEPVPAFVTRVGHGNLNLNVLDPQSYNMRIRDGVRHLADPDAKDMERSESGLWDFTLWDKTLMELVGMDGQGKLVKKVIPAKAG